MPGQTGIRLIATALCAIAAQSHPSSQQQSTPTFRASSNALTLIAAVVDDATGRPVTDLRPEDFTVTVAGTSAVVRVADFVHVLGTAGSTDATAAQSVAPRAEQTDAPRHLLFLLDDESMTSEEVIELRATLPRTLVNFEPSDRIGVMTTSGRPAAVAPTAERAPVLTAFREADGRLVDERGSLFVGLDEAIDIARGFPLDTFKRVVARECSGMAGGAAMTVNCDDLVLAHARRLAAESSERFKMQADAVRRAIGTMAGMSAPRVVVWLSGGVAAAADPDERRTAVRRLTEEAASSGVQIFALTALGEEGDVRDTSYERANARRRSRAAATDGLRVITHAAGGETFAVVGQADRFHQRIAAETAGYYRLAVDLPAASTDGAGITATVTVNRPGALVRTSGRAWVDMPATPPTLKSLFETGVKSTTVPLGVVVQPRRHPSGQVEVVLEIRATPETYPATVIFGLMDHKGAFVTAGQRDVAAAGPDGLRLLFSLTVFPGTYRLRVAVGEDGETGRYGLAEFPVNADLGVSPPRSPR